MADGRSDRRGAARVKWRIDFEAFDGLMAIEASGPLRVEGFFEFLKAASTDPGRRKGMSILLDFRDLDTDRVEYPDIQRIAAVFATYAPTIGGTRVALIVSRPQDYGLMKIWEVLVGDVFSAHKICYTTEDALAFLHGGTGGVS